jgi:hypothetical protein
MSTTGPVGDGRMYLPGAPGGRPVPPPPQFPPHRFPPPQAPRPIPTPPPAFSGYGNVPAPPPPGGGRNTGLIVAIVAVVVVLLAGSAVGAWFLLRDQPQDDRAQSETATQTTVPTSAPARSSTQPTSSSAPAAVSLPPGSQTCPSTAGPVNGYASSAVGTTITSCPFAEAVRVAYASGGQAGTPRVVDAVSPVTNRSYSMNCTVAARLVTCTGGDNAVVHVY